MERERSFGVFRFFGKIEKSMPKWLPKSMKIGPESDLEPTRVDCFSALWCFRARPKNHDFLMPLRWLKKSENRSEKRPGGAKPATPDRRPAFSWRPGALGRPRARPGTKVLETRNQGTKEQGTKKQRNKERETEQRNEECVR